MKTKMKYIKMLATVVIIAGVSLIFSQCKKDDSVNALTGTPVTGSGIFDTSWTFDKVHCNVGWESPYYDVSSTMLTGRFGSFGIYSPVATNAYHGYTAASTTNFLFDETNLSACYMKTWVQLSSNSTSEAGRDGYGKCGPSYLGVVYTNMNKDTVLAPSDTAWFESTGAWIKSGTGYVVNGNFTFNRNRSNDSYITHPVTMYVTYGGVLSFANTNGTHTLRGGLIGKFSFNRSDYVDLNNTVQYLPVPATHTDSVNNVTAANFPTYGVYSHSVADQMDITINVEFNKTIQ